MYDDMEDDDNYRDRIADAIPPGAYYTAEELSDASEKDLDAIGKRYGVKRKKA